MSENSIDSALPFIAWSRVWSSVVPEEMQAEAWQALGLPDDFTTYKTDYWTLFHTGMPAPKVPLLLHAALNMEGNSVREDWLRVLSHLELEWEDLHMPPDQLGIACEIYACVIDRQEDFLIEELRTKYLRPWCDFALARLEHEESPLTFIVQHFAANLDNL